MSNLRVRLSAIGIVTAMLLTLAAPLFAGNAAHPICLTKPHDCDKTAQLKSCCCLTPGDRSDDATPAAGKTEIAAPIADARLDLIDGPAAALGLAHHPQVVTAPRSSPPDLVTLFGTFLI